MNTKATAMDMENEILTLLVLAGNSAEVAMEIRRIGFRFRIISFIANRKESIEDRQEST